MSVQAEDWLDRGRLLRLLLVLGLVLAPHAPHLPPWISLSLLALILWRTAAAWHGWRLPGRVLRTLLTVAAFAGVFLSFGRSTGQAAGTAMLCMMIGLKLTELSSRRDVVVVLLLLYFALFTHFLRDQAMWTVLWMLASVLLITALLIDSHRLQRQGWRADLFEAGRMTLLAVPLMLVLWLLFPRIPGPLWGAPVNSASARTGMSEEMSPGDIAQLSRSDAVAFRVDFEGAPPAPQMRYWRGPMLWLTDGRRWEVWRAGKRDEAPELRLVGERLSYTLTIEPQKLHYVYALDVADPTRLPDALALNTDGAVVRKHGSNDRRAYTLHSHPDYLLQPRLNARERRAALQLPARANPRSRALAAGWAAEGLSPPELIQRALSMYRREGFVYTLSPPLLGDDPVDAFLFDSRRGFCEHYAGSFVTLMRAAGLPARVVLGYQGGEESSVGDYLIVRQSDAHAWAEVWMEETGWQRIDPTAAVAPDRIEQSLEAALAERGERLPAHWSRDFAAGQWLAARWDFLDMQWNRWVLAYGPELQKRLLSGVGLGDWQRMLLALTAAIALLMAVIALLAVRRSLHRHERDPLQREWQRLLRRLEHQGLAQRPGEGPRDYAERVRAALRGPARRSFGQAADSYLRARYVESELPAEARRLVCQQLRQARACLPLVILPRRRGAAPRSRRRRRGRFA